MGSKTRLVTYFSRLRSDSLRDSLLDVMTEKLLRSVKCHALLIALGAGAVKRHVTGCIVYHLLKSLGRKS